MFFSSLPSLLVLILKFPKHSLPTINGTGSVFNPINRTKLQPFMRFVTIFAACVGMLSCS